MQLLAWAPGRMVGKPTRSRRARYVWKTDLCQFRHMEQSRLLSQILQREAFQGCLVWPRK